MKLDWAGICSAAEELQIMFRNIAILIVGASAIANLNAGSVTLTQVGGNTGLTSSQVSVSNFTLTSPNSTFLNSTAGTATGVNGSVICTGGTATSCTNNLPNTATPTTGYPANEFLTGTGAGAGVTFSMINQSATSGTWEAPAESGSNTGTATMTITLPGGVFGVTNVYTMINDLVANTSASNQDPTSVQFIFANSADNETFNLYDGYTIRSNDVGGTLAGNVSNLGGGTYSDSTNPGTSCYGLNSTTAQTCAAATASVSAFNIWNGTDTHNTNGVLNLDAQDFNLGAAAAGDTLEQIIITNTASATSRDLVTAVDLQTLSSAPEPASILLILSGIGALGLVRRRQKQQ